MPEIRPSLQMIELKSKTVLIRIFMATRTDNSVRGAKNNIFYS